METYRGSIYKDDTLVADNILIELEVVSKSGRPRSWHGQFNLPLDALVKFGENANRIVLEDGRQGFFVLDRLLTNSEGLRLFIFKGNGPLK